MHGERIEETIKKEKKNKKVKGEQKAGGVNSAYRTRG